MSVRDWWRGLQRKPVAAAPEPSTVDAGRPELREFVYLDEVSLRSLLSSQKGGVTESMSEQATDARELGLTGTAGVSSPLIAKAELESRYQTSNSSTLQTSRKATVQSWFRELHEIDGLRLIEPVLPSAPAADSQELIDVLDPSLLATADSLRRGKPVEFRVQLSADPVFHLGTMVSEYAGMADDYPDMFTAGNSIASLREVLPINKILQRLLAGLIPIRGTAVDHLVVELNNVEYIVHKGIIEGLDLPTRPLQIVGVTEHLAYWKDIRRVLFSDAEFTMLCRVSRSGLQDSWTPVKLADLFRDVTPGLVDQINAAGQTPFAISSGVPAESANEGRLGAALTSYSKALVAHLECELDPNQRGELDALILRSKTHALTVSDQRAAFGSITETIFEMTRKRPDPDLALQLRDDARREAGLSLFPTLTTTPAALPTAEVKDPAPLGPRLLDVDVVAIYW